MKTAYLKWASSLLLVLSIPTWGALTPEDRAKLPVPASHTVSFRDEIKPILETSCIKCHGRGKTKGGFQLESRESLLKGGDSGPAIVLGQSAESYLIELVSGLDPENIMPEKGTKLTPLQVGLLRAWIDQGAPWDPQVNFGKVPPVNLKPRKPENIDLTTSGNPIDSILSGYLKTNAVDGTKTISDRAFARRVFLDLIGLLPTPDDLAEFENDSRPDKRKQLVRQLLSDNQRYAEHWLTFWNDALRNDYKGTGYIDGGRKQITGWLYSALARNIPFNQFVSELINPSPEAEGFVKGIVWRGVVNASQTPQMQAAQNVSQVFMGVNLKCASCHDSFINDWALADAYGLASVYADQELELVQCDKPLGKLSQMKFIYPELGSIDAKAPKAERLKQLSQIIAKRENGRLTRTIVNRLWSKLMGRGLVEPVDDMESRPWNQDLLDWLAEDLAENNYDLKKTLERIVTSAAYQMPAVPAHEQSAGDYIFQGPFVRRMSAEQFLDALAAITGVWNTLPAPHIDYSPGLSNQWTSADRAVQPRWIWKESSAALKAAPGTVYFRKTIHLPVKPTSASAVISCDNSFKLFVNGKEIASSKDHTRPALADLRPHLNPGRNVIAVEAVNDTSKETNANPAGLIFYARVRHERLAPVQYIPAGAQGSTSKPDTLTGRQLPVETVLDFASDRSWLWSDAKADGWEQPDFAATGWTQAAALGDADMAPWNLGKKLAEEISTAALYGRVRAALVNADPLMTALGRPNREQVITIRASAATTLQALELTNGSTLAAHLKQGAEQVTAQTPPDQLIPILYQRALSRPPTAPELQLAQELVGTPPQKEGVEDLLWALAMLPEFQLIY